MSQATRIGATLGASLMLALSACSDAQADSWTGRDKQMHLVAGAAIALPVTLITQDIGAVRTMTSREIAAEEAAR